MTKGFLTRAELLTKHLDPFSTKNVFLYSPLLFIKFVSANKERNALSISNIHLICAGCLQSDKHTRGNTSLNFRGHSFIPSICCHLGLVWQFIPRNLSIFSLFSGSEVKGAAGHGCGRHPEMLPEVQTGVCVLSCLSLSRASLTLN